MAEAMPVLLVGERAASKLAPGAFPPSIQGEALSYASSPYATASVTDTAQLKRSLGDSSLFLLEAW